MPWPSGKLLKEPIHLSNSRQEYICQFCYISQKKGELYLYHGYGKGEFSARVKYCLPCSEKMKVSNRDTLRVREKYAKADRILKLEVREYYREHSLYVLDPEVAYSIG